MQDRKVILVGAQMIMETEFLINSNTFTVQMKMNVEQGISIHCTIVKY